MRQRRDRAPLLLGNVRMQLGERPDLDFVDQPARLEERRRGLHRLGQRDSHRLGHQRCRIAARFAPQREPLIIGVSAVDGDGVGVHQQLAGVEPEPLLRRVRAVGPKPVARTGAEPRHMPGEDPAGRRFHLDPVGLGVAVRVEQAEPDAFRSTRPYRKPRTVLRRHRAKDRQISGYISGHGCGAGRDAFPPPEGECRAQ